MIRFLLSILFLLFSIAGFSQHSDSLYEKSKNFIAEEKFQEAGNILDQLILKEPNNLDYISLRAHLYYWNKNYDSAFIYCKQILDKEPLHYDCFLLRIKILHDTQKFAEAIERCNEGIQYFQAQRDLFVVQKAKSMAELNQRKEAIDLLDGLQKNSTYYIDGQYLKTELLKKNPNMISLGYLNTSFPNGSMSPWHIGHLEYAHKRKKMTWAGRLSTGSTQNNLATQFEVDAYYVTKPNQYLYGNIGFSDGRSIFPSFRMGSEYYIENPKYILSAGFRFLQFNPAQVFMLTGHVGKNYKSYSFSYRPFFALIQSNWYATHGAILRKNFERKESYIQIEAQYGAVPYFYFINQTYSKLNSTRAIVNVRFSVKNNFFVQPICIYEWEEFAPNQYRNRLNMQLILARRF